MVDLGENPSVPFPEDLPEGSLISVNDRGFCLASASSEERSTVLGVRVGNRIVSTGIVPMRVLRLYKFKQGQRLYLSDLIFGTAQPFVPAGSGCFVSMVGVSMDDFDGPCDSTGDVLIPVFYGGLLSIRLP